MSIMNSGAYTGANGGRWSAEKANQWYAHQPWPCGFNYIPATAINYTEMWMPYSFDVKLIDQELALGEGVGFNCVRVVLPFVVWEHDPGAFKQRVRDFLAVCDQRGQRVMLVLFDDCGEIKNPKFGRQPDVVKGVYANAWSASPGHDMVRNPATWPRLRDYVTDVIASFQDDPRVWVWDLYNEPTNSGLGDATLPLLVEVIAWARRVAPPQPLTVGQWNKNEALNNICWEHSDIITFHDYNGPDRLAEHIESLKSHGRPIINTEWLCRHQQSVPETCLPIFRRENVGCLHWGLVNGRTQTHLHWGWTPDRGEPNVWQHDLYHGDHSPYQAAELRLFRHVIAGEAGRR